MCVARNGFLAAQTSLRAIMVVPRPPTPGGLCCHQTNIISCPEVCIHIATTATTCLTPPPRASQSLVCLVPLGRSADGELFTL